MRYHAVSWSRHQISRLYPSSRSSYPFQQSILSFSCSSIRPSLETASLLLWREAWVWYALWGYHKQTVKQDALSPHPAATDSYQTGCWWFLSLQMSATYLPTFVRRRSHLASTQFLAGLRTVDLSCRGSNSYPPRLALWSLTAQCLLSTTLVRKMRVAVFFLLVGIDLMLRSATLNSAIATLTVVDFERT